MSSPSPSVLELKGEIDLSTLISGYEQGAIQYNASSNTLANLREDGDRIQEEIDVKLKDKHKEETYKRGAQLLMEKIDYNKQWISRLYLITKITHIILALIVILMIIYKLMNKKK